MKFHDTSYVELGAAHMSVCLLLPDLLDCSRNLEVLVSYEGFVEYCGLKSEVDYQLPAGRILK